MLMITIRDLNFSCGTHTALSSPAVRAGPDLIESGGFCEVRMLDGAAWQDVGPHCKPD